MSAPEHTGGEQFEPQRSKIKLSRNAKGDPQWEVSVIDGAHQEDLDQLREIAVAQYRALEQELLYGRSREAA